MFKALIAFLALPGLVAGLLPVILIRIDSWRFSGSLWAVPVAVGGAFVLGKCVWDFYRFGQGTLAHWDPPKRLVNVGLYRRVRNPMYLGVIILVLGLGLTFGSIVLLIYLVLVSSAFHLHVVIVEEPWLARQFPEEWEEYTEHISRWWPRL